MLQRSPPPSISHPARGPEPGSLAAGITVAGAVPSRAAERVAKQAGNAALVGTIQRLEEVVDQETAALRGRAAVDLKDFNDKKNQALLELSRALRHVQGGGNEAALSAQLGTLRGKLEINRAVLQMHVEAVREISATLADAIRDADSDGTYSQVIRTASKKQ